MTQVDPKLRRRLLKAVNRLNENDFRDMPEASYDEIIDRLWKAPVIPEVEIGGSRPFRGSNLSPREREIVAAMSHGLDNKMIAELYCMSLETVKTHLKRIMAKLAAKNRTQVVAIALRQGIID